MSSWPTAPRSPTLCATVPKTAKTVAVKHPRQTRWTTPARAGNASSRPATTPPATSTPAPTPSPARCWPFTGAARLAAVAQQPEYLIEYLSLDPDARMARVTARGFGTDPAVEVVVQSYLALD
ncbi:MAG: hypothetical protein MUE43_11515 [Serpentinimonas sp.]|nr:hypothetical protein [Serpentinimonas sp.]